MSCSLVIGVVCCFTDRSVTRSYYRGAAGALLVYDISRFEVFVCSSSLSCFLHFDHYTCSDLSLITSFLKFNLVMIFCVTK